MTNPRTTLALLDDDEKGLQSVQTLGGPQEMTVVTAALTAAMDCHPAGKHRTTRTPPLLNADGAPADTLPTTPEDHA
ncbi:hypothetical protein KM867_09105 [Micrococcus luteus]|uniref:hypothetical protein n=1 Tax=Micrococcus luteus TaxID=1270 RepID=UPI001C247975|nr:hypothetical protein [Micrococcus luteus]MBU8650788.1 hypothetical protein [Micrococcus luteus]